MQKQLAYVWYSVYSYTGFHFFTIELEFSACGDMLVLLYIALEAYYETIFIQPSHCIFVLISQGTPIVLHCLGRAAMWANFEPIMLAIVDLLVYIVPC